ncbi:MAG: sulfotransferase family 2 domain-containing protein [Pseudomonadota bacterium]
MSTLSEILPNYQSRRHLLQNVHLPARTYGGPKFLYMKNHKAACTNVLTLLITQIHAALSSEAVLDISMDAVHNLPTDYLRAGARGLDWPTVEDALFGPEWFRFTIIREPLNRTVSAWSDKLQGNTRQRRDLNKVLGRDPETEISLPAFLDIIAQDDTARMIDRHWRPQHLEISFDQVRYDLIGRVEDMAAARAQIIETLFGARGLKLRILDTREHLGHRSSSRADREALTAQDRRNVERAFARDFDMYARVASAPVA